MDTQNQRYCYGSDLLFSYLHVSLPFDDQAFTQKAVFNRKISFFGCHDTKLALVLLRKLFFTRGMFIPKITAVDTNIWSTMYFNLVHAHKPKFAVPNFFLARFFSFLFLLLLPFVFHILSGCCKTLGVNYGQRLGNGTLINYWYNGCTKTDYVFQFSMSECCQYPKPTVVGIIDLS